MATTDIAEIVETQEKQTTDAERLDDLTKRVKWLEIVETTDAERLDDLIERVEALEKA